jgi:hypothetical protein
MSAEGQGDSPRVTAAGRGSGRATLQRRLAAVLGSSPTIARWTNEGFVPDLDLLGRVLAHTDPTQVRGASVATGLDFWVAAMLRQAGVRGVVPQATEPFYVSGLATALQAEFSNVEDAVRDLEVAGRQVSQRELGRAIQRSTRQLASATRRIRSSVERSTVAILGESRRKQVDVFVAEWDRGLELLVSTKTVALAAPEELVKNLPNRWEEFDGDLKNLRGRFPLAVIGALLMIPASARANSLPAFVDMMLKLTAADRPWVNAYDCAALIIADWDRATGDSVPIRNAEFSSDDLPPSLQPEQFFRELLHRLLDRAPVTEHVEARMAARRARGDDPSVIERAAQFQAARENE